jgi:cbb3-type cytochrome oxidase maturation protein
MIFFLNSAEFWIMGMIYIMLIVSLVIALFFLASFFWATKEGQFDDDYTPSVRILFDDETNQKSNQKSNGSTEV